MSQIPNGIGSEMEEKKLQELIAGYLSKWFYVQREVWSTDHKRRIDIVILHKKYLKDFSYPIGIEVKVDAKKRGKDLAEWLKQAQDYSTKDFKGFGKIMVCTYPQIAGKYMEEGTDISKHDINSCDRLACHHNVNTFLGQFGIGELQRYKIGQNGFLRIVFKSYPIWDSRTDVFREEFYKSVCSQKELQYSQAH
jgi:hypothetical protein